MVIAKIPSLNISTLFFHFHDSGFYKVLNSCNSIYSFKFAAKKLFHISQIIFNDTAKELASEQ